MGQEIRRQVVAEYRALCQGALLLHQQVPRRRCFCRRSRRAWDQLPEKSIARWAAVRAPARWCCSRLACQFPEFCAHQPFAPASAAAFHVPAKRQWAAGPQPPQIAAPRATPRPEAPANRKCTNPPRSTILASSPLTFAINNSKTPAVAHHALNGMPDIAAGNTEICAIHIYVAGTEIDVCVADFQSKRAVFRGIKFDDASQVQHQVRRAAVAVDKTGAPARGNRSERPRITVKSRPRFSEKSKMIPPDAAFDAE